MAQIEGACARQRFLPDHAASVQEIFESFGLDWWVQRLRPVLDQFVMAAAGEPDREFWQGIYKFRPPSGPYDASMVTGWVVDLFPYLGVASNRRRNHAFDDSGGREVAAGAFPPGLCKVSVRLSLVDDDHRELASRDLDLVAGLFGLQQLGTGLAPVISWCLVDPTPPKKPERPGFDEIRARVGLARPTRS